VGIDGAVTHGCVRSSDGDTSRRPNRRHEQHQLATQRVGGMKSPARRTLFAVIPHRRWVRFRASETPRVQRVDSVIWHEVLKQPVGLKTFAQISDSQEVSAS
jgi:hypothetical protein